MAADSQNAEPSIQSLTGHVSQSADDGQLFSPPSSPSSPTQHPYNFDFPTLEEDGSVSDLTTHQARPGPYATPPAALSALGNKTMADRGYTSEPEGSLADQYDMIDHDDLSEISNDDHDTASLHSNEPEHDGQLSPELPESEQEEDEAQYVDTALVFQDVPDPFGGMPSNASSSSVVMVDSSTAQQIQTENELIDSYMSDDLETPRQSILPFISTTASGPVPMSGPEPNTPFTTGQPPLKILFVSNEDEPQADMDLIISRATAALRSSSSDAVNRYKVVRLPPTPARADSSGTAFVYRPMGIEATVQHCVSAKRQSFGSYALSLVDHEGYRHSWLMVSADGKSDVQKPDLIVFHVRDCQNRTLLEAVESMNVPTFAIVENEALLYFDFNQTSTSTSAVKGKDFIGMDHASLSRSMSHLMGLPSDKTPSRSDSSALRPSLFMALIAALVYMALLCFDVGPNFDVAARRDALVSSLDRISSEGNLPNATSLVDVNHLLPAVPAACSDPAPWYQFRRDNSSECEMNARFQQLNTNHVMLALPRHVHSPHIVTATISKSNGRNISFNMTELIDGVSLFTFDPSEAYGDVNVNVVTAKPAQNITAPCYYGKRLFQRETRGNAGTEVGKKIGSELAIMSKTAQKLNGLFSYEIAASVQATRNVTTQLALYVSRELQVFGKTTNSVFHRAGRANKEAAKSLAKDLTVVQKDVLRFTKDLSLSVKSSVSTAKRNAKALVQAPLARSRQRVQEFKEALRHKKLGRKIAKVDDVGTAKMLRRVDNAVAKLEAKYEAIRPYLTYRPGSKDQSDTESCLRGRVPCNRCTKTGKFLGLPAREFAQRH
ncbi:hypothetical protein CERZMDRAFT_81685 [Cercospora zeae-maydis SCOH1-5]|uniref:Uncharacterized protein n=1 Tax=Cercospora zeae-maydis SCOH1-5 TaxID=717836 RepID=A0A6A6FT05_9PEZI|nr:hypothetical protein CERZMDRAFT_81685 [Cercospora zeae-maydis SCOH1-5]